MRIVAWIGNEPNQKALVNKIHREFPLAAIVTETRASKRKISARLLFEKVIEKVFLSSIGKAWWEMLKHYEKAYPRYPEVEILDVENINSDAVYQFTAKYNPDVILVSGTRLVKERMFGLNPHIGILNLHTGLSPYVKGGPNCTNWCIAKEEFHLIGNTIMWIDKGIDTGSIISTECTPLEASDDLLALHIRVMDHAHDLYLRALRYLAAGKEQRVNQAEIGAGTTYYTRDWTLGQKFKLVKNFPKLRGELESGRINERRKSLKTVGLGE